MAGAAREDRRWHDALDAGHTGKPGAWPQARSQKRGVGFPILRMVVLLSLATAALSGVAVGPYKGKQTGEPALLRELFDRFQAGDVFLGDCCFASYFLLALLLARGVDAVVRQHQRRRTDFRFGERLGRKDHVVVWQRPACPPWMDEETYARFRQRSACAKWGACGGPRLSRAATRGRDHADRCASLSTSGDCSAVPRAVERGTRSAAIKVSLHMDDLRCKSPEMVRREILVHWLAYNLIRKVMAQAAMSRAVAAELSFAAAIAAIGRRGTMRLLPSRTLLTALAQTQWRLIAWHEVGHRPNRVEPRRSNGVPRRTSCSASPARRRGTLRFARANRQPSVPLPEHFSRRFLPGFAETSFFAAVLIKRPCDTAAPPVDAWQCRNSSISPRRDRFAGRLSSISRTTSHAKETLSL